MNDIAVLISQPRNEISSLDLMGAVVAEADTGEVIDARARAEYETRIRELQEDLDEAEAMNDAGHADSIRSELDALVSHLTRGIGLGGRARRAGGSAEKARSAVTWRVRSAIRRIEEALPAAGDHLDRFISTGRSCVYDPPDATVWQVKT